MDKRHIKALSEAYDKAYDLNSVFGFPYEFNGIVDSIEKMAKKRGYKFVLRRDKWKAVKDVV